MPDSLHQIPLSVSDVIAIAALIIAIFSAKFSRDAKISAQKANDIAVHNNLRSSRLEVYRSMLDFAQFCCKYPTKWHENPVPTEGTRNLMQRIDNFKWQIEQQGPLALPLIENKIKEFQNKANQMQILLDRLAANRNEPRDQNYPTAKDNLDAIVDWFATEQQELKNIFSSYI